MTSINQSINQSIDPSINKSYHFIISPHKVTKKLFEEKELLNSVRGGVEA